jgi:plasmid stability protein
MLASFAVIHYNAVNASMRSKNMATITVRNLDNNLKSQLRLRAARHGCSMEAEVRNILAETLNPATAERNFAVAIRKRFETLYTESLPIPPRQAVRTPPDFGD